LNLEGPLSKKDRKIILREKKEKKENKKLIKKEDLLREIIVKIRLKEVDIQEGITVEALLNSNAIELVISLEFSRKQRFRLRKIERPIYVRNIDGFFNKKRLIKHIVEVNIYYQGHREITEIDMIGEQK